MKNSKHSIASELRQADPATQIMDEMVLLAMGGNALGNNRLNGTSTKASEGSVADHVVFTKVENEFVTKLQKDRSIIKEANFLNMLPFRDELPAGFFNYFPRVYFIKNDQAPYGYTMERFRMKSLAYYVFVKRISKKRTVKTINAVLDILLPVYFKTIDHHTRPSIRNIYCKRIVDRLAEARLSNFTFERLSTQPIMINGVKYQTPEFYLAVLESRFRDFLVPFTTFIHGDCHPENILVDYHEKNEIVIKFIDPKGHYNGDYLFDMGKISHYFLGTGPAQEMINPLLAEIKLDPPVLNYDIQLEKFNAQELVRLISHRIANFAEQVQDRNWELRFQLSIAANLLGLPAARLRSNDPVKNNSAFILYGEGLIHLAKCCE